MKRKILSTVKFVPASKKPQATPLQLSPFERAVETITNSLLVQSEYAATLLRGEPLKKRVRRMFWQQPDGTWRFKLRLGLDPVVFDSDENEIQVNSLEEVIGLCETLIEAVHAGELDEEIKETVRTRPVRGRYAKKQTPEDEIEEEVEEEIEAKPATPLRRRVGRSAA